MIESNFDIPFVADLALREKQIQQNYRPIIAVHKWFARRPGTLFRALLLSEFVDGPLRDAFHRGNSLRGKRIADPFMGGGTPLVESNRLGCDVVGYDINPMSYWVVRQEIEHLDLTAYRRSGDDLRRRLERQLGHFYRTRCLLCGSSDASVKYFLWVKFQNCTGCQVQLDLFPGYLVAQAGRHPTNVLLCAACGALNERDDVASPGKCDVCRAPISMNGPAARNRIVCPHCQRVNRYPDPTVDPRHRLFAIEYHCSSCKPGHSGRFFKRPDPEDLAKIDEAERKLARLKARFIPDDEIPAGDETDRLHRWGYRHYREMFSARQLLGLESSCRLIAAVKDERIRHALSTNLSDLLRYQNMLCRYDTMALKSLDIFSVHGYPVGLVQCESNLLGIPSESAGLSVGSGGWSNILDKFEKAKAYCDAPFEIRHEAGRKVRVAIPGEWIGDHRNGRSNGESRQVDLRCADASKADIPPASLDAVFTDPPYFGSVQYAELMDFCYVWLRRLIMAAEPAFQGATTRHISELTENDNMKRGLESFSEGLAAVFTRMAAALKPNAPLAFTYHHNRLEAYVPVVIAILDSGLTCTATLPCPAEMEASIHINGTGSSIVDTVFVCRSQPVSRSKLAANTPAAAARAVASALRQLRDAGLEPTDGDTRCIIFGQMTRMAVNALRRGWNLSRHVSDKLKLAAQKLDSLSLEAIQTRLLRTPQANGRRKRNGGTCP